MSLEGALPGRETGQEKRLPEKNMKLDFRC